ncbi:DNA-binding transcription factor yap1 [Borealophlyctis nickersoniae]|nr:DNA-binding transcription factor yap1 [Borealophlyctis nickersoniae]
MSDRPPDTTDQISPSTTPGSDTRKRKRSASVLDEEATPEASSCCPLHKRTAQNRAAQRAFRERKEKHVKELEARVAELEAALKTGGVSDPCIVRQKEEEHEKEKRSLREEIGRLTKRLGEVEAEARQLRCAVAAYLTTNAGAGKPGWAGHEKPVLTPCDGPAPQSEAQRQFAPSCMSIGGEKSCGTRTCVDIGAIAALGAMTGAGLLGRTEFISAMQNQMLGAMSGSSSPASVTTAPPLAHGPSTTFSASSETVPSASEASVVPAAPSLPSLPPCTTLPTGTPPTLPTLSTLLAHLPLSTSQDPASKYPQQPPPPQLLPHLFEMYQHMPPLMHSSLPDPYSLRRTSPSARIAPVPADLPPLKAE